MPARFDACLSAAAQAWLDGHIALFRPLAALPEDPGRSSFVMPPVYRAGQSSVAIERPANSPMRCSKPGVRLGRG